MISNVHTEEKQINIGTIYQQCVGRHEKKNKEIFSLLDR